MTPQELKNSILQLAIQGKLVEQRPEEGTAEELYRQIQAKKQALIKAGKIKKEKPLPEITEDEKPFDIPESWMWVRVTDCIANRAGLAYDKGNLDIHSDNMIRVLRGGNITDMGYSTKPDDIMISAEFVKPELFLRRNTIITPAVTSLDHVGKMGRIEADYDNMVVGGFVLMLTPHLNEDVFSRYLLCAFSSKYFRDRCRGIVNKSGQAFYNLSRGKLMEIVIPLPPLAEQKRIVAKIEELLPLIDRYEQAWSRLEDFNKRFPVDMQKSILQMAIQGKLVEQRPEEGTGEELYRRIQAEKQAFIKAGKIKKEKPLPEIAEDEIPFEIPESWKWVRLGNAISLLSGTDFKPDEYNDQHRGTTYITGASCLSETGVIESRWTETPRCIARKGDVLLVCKGSGYGKTVICDVEEAHIARQIMAVQCSGFFDMHYIMYYLNANLRLIKANGQGVIPGIDRGSVLNMVFPLPPLAEQKRIVARLEELLPLCERLK